MHSRINLTNNDSNILYISNTTIDKSFNSSLHTHKNLEIILVIDGQGEVITSNRKILVGKHDLLIINPNSKHYEVGEGLTFIALGIKDTNIYLQETYTKKIIVKKLDESTFAQLKHLFDMIGKEALRKGSESNHIIDLTYQIITSYILETLSLKQSKYDGNDSEIVSNIKDILSSYFASDINLDELAHRLSISKAGLCHKFKAETGKTIIQYKLEKQIEEACNLLRISDMSISQIAFMVGFNSDAYFIKVFKSIQKCTPKEYRTKSII